MQNIVIINDLVDRKHGRTQEAPVPHANYSGQRGHGLDYNQLKETNISTGSSTVE